MASEDAARNPSAADPGSEDHSHSHAKVGPALVLACLGVVYGDIGTSPLYALRESLVHAHEEGLPETSVIGIVSLLFWTVVLIVTVKYVLLILRADNNGEGGTLSLVAKAQGALKVGPLAKRRRLLMLLGIVGVSLFFGDSMITPAISVLSAVEGLKVDAPAPLFLMAETSSNPGWQALDPAPLRRIPTLYPGERQLPGGPGLPPVSQPFFDGMEPDLPALDRQETEGADHQ